MEMVLLCVGKTAETELEHLITTYDKRINHYVKFSTVVIPAVKTRKKENSKIQKEKERILLEKQIEITDKVMLLDESGKDFTSKQFSSLIQTKLNMGLRRLVFVVGGAYGFSEAFQRKYPEKIALSKMTFSHQMVRLFFCEQLYRAFTILNKHPYHNN